MRTESISKSIRNRLFETGLGDGSLVPAYQPIVDLKTGRISSFEVLARWNDDDLGTVSPVDFIPLIEQAGLLDQMTDRLMSAACSAAAAWPGEFRLAFNLSPTQFVEPDLANRIANAARTGGFAVDRMQVEITESTIFSESDQIKININALKDMGIRIILDDFGTGFSSLKRLQEIAFDKLKIDASFVRAMDADRSSRKITSAVIGLGHSMGMSVVAEGIETDKQMNLLRWLGCDYGQGFFLSEAVFAQHVPALLNERGQAAHDPKPVEMSCNQRLAELDALYENDSVAICFVDKSFRLVSVSRSFCRITGIDTTTATHRTVDEVFPYNGALVMALIKTMLADGRNRPCDSLVNTGNGLFTFRFDPAKDEGGDVVGVSLSIPIHSSVDNQQILSRSHNAGLRTPAFDTAPQGAAVCSNAVEPEHVSA